MKRRDLLLLGAAALGGCGGGMNDESDSADALAPQDAEVTVGSAITKQRFDGVLRQPHRSADKWFDASQANTYVADYYDFRPLLPPMGDEGKLNSCVGFAEGAQVALLYPGLTPSALFVWNNARIIEGTLAKNVGVTPGDAAQSIATSGVCHEAKCRYSVSRWNKVPPHTAYTDAKSYRAPRNLRLAKLEDMVACIASGFSFSFTAPILNEINAPSVYSTGVIPMPDPTGPSRGLHRFLAVGMDVANSYFLIRNSWGTSWGLGGYAWMPFGWVGAVNALAVDHMTLRRSA